MYKCTNKASGGSASLLLTIAENIPRKKETKKKLLT